MYINMTTGEVYDDLRHAIKTIIHDIIKYPLCRTFKMFYVRRLEEA